MESSGGEQLLIFLGFCFAIMAMFLVNREGKMTPAVIAFLVSAIMCPVIVLLFQIGTGG